MDRFHYWLIFMILLAIINNLAIVDGGNIPCNCKCSSTGKCISGSSTAKCNQGCLSCTSNCDCCLPCCPPVLKPDQPPCCDCGHIG